MENYLKFHPPDNLYAFFLSIKKNQVINKKIYKTDEHPKVAKTLTQIAMQWKKMGDYQKALDQLERVLRKNSDLDKNESILCFILKEIYLDIFKFFA